MWTIATGNPWDGIALLGIFEDVEEANAHAEIECRNSDWWVVEITPVVGPDPQPQSAA